jgi:hypothetical protein
MRVLPAILAAITLTLSACGGSGSTPKYADVDRNGDGFACSRITGNGGTIIIDNNDSAPSRM